jgi:hypothetical protein
VSAKSSLHGEWYFLEVLGARSSVLAPLRFLSLSFSTFACHPNVQFGVCTIAFLMLLNCVFRVLVMCCQHNGEEISSNCEFYTRFVPISHCIYLPLVLKLNLDVIRSAPGLAFFRSLRTLILDTSEIIDFYFSDVLI